MTYEHYTIPYRIVTLVTRIASNHGRYISVNKTSVTVNDEVGSAPSCCLVFPYCRGKMSELLREFDVRSEYPRTKKNITQKNIKDD